MSDPRFESPLHHAAATSGSMAINVREITDRGMIDLRGSLGSRKFTAAVRSVLGCALPKEPRGSLTSGELTILWLSVDQWLICCPRDKAQDLTEALREALSGVHSLAVNLSDARAIIRLEGETAREVMMKGAPVDLTDPEYAAGSVRRLRFADVAGMVHFVSTDPDVLDLYVFRSYADYAWDWILETGRSAAKLKLFGEQAIPSN